MKSCTDSQNATFHASANPAELKALVEENFPRNENLLQSYAEPARRKGAFVVSLAKAECNGCYARRRRKDWSRDLPGCQASARRLRRSPANDEWCDYPCAELCGKVGDDGLR